MCQTAFGLNRTFYGIETQRCQGRVRRADGVLIVPFMELKLDYSKLTEANITGLNRTFYGIETQKKQQNSD